MLNAFWYNLIVSDHFLERLTMDLTTYLIYILAKVKVKTLRYITLQASKTYVQTFESKS